MRRFLAVLILTLVSSSYEPSLARADGETQVWSALFMQYRPTHGGIAGWFDTQVRRGSTTIWLLRPGIGWGIGKNLTFHAGYGYIHTFVDGGVDKKENRAWQQVLYNHAVSNEVKLQGRFRPEQRFLDGDDGTGHRIRLLGRVQYGPRPEWPQLVIIDELFLQLNDTTALKSGFNQNRLFVGLGADTKLHGLRAEAGYQNIKFGAANMDRMDHAFVVNVMAVIH